MIRRLARGVWVTVVKTVTSAWHRTTTIRLVLLAAVVTATPAWGQQQAPSALKIPSTATVGGRFGSDYGEAYLSIFAPISQKEDGLIFLNPRFALKDEGASEGNLGIGIRQMLSNQKAIIGANLYVDRSRSRYDIDHDQWGLGLEFLTDSWDFRANYYDPGSSTPIAATTDINTLSSVTEVMRSVATTQTITESLVSSRTNVVNTDFYRGNNILGQTVSTRTDRVRTTTDTRQTTTTTFTTTDTFTDLLFEKREGGLDGYDLELGYKFPLPETMPEVRLFGGYYDFEGPFNSEIKGAKGRLEVRAGEYFTFDAEVFDDEELHGSDYFIGARVNLPFSFSNLVNGKNPFLNRKHDMITFRNRSLAARMGEEVIRDVEVHVAESPFVENRAKRRVTKEQSVAVEVDVVDTSEFSDRNVVTVRENARFYTSDGDRITVTHVDSNATGADVGTFEDPNQTLTAANATQAADANDIILLHSDSSFDGESVNVTDDQSLVGQGGGIQTTVDTDQGALVLPEAGNPNGTTATINNGGVQINSDNVLVNNVIIDQGSVTTAAGETHSGLTITNVQVNTSGGNGVELGVNGGALDGTITLENITVDGSAGSGIVLENVLATGTVIGNSNSASGNAANGIDILNNAGTVTFTDTTTSNNGNAGIFIENTTGTTNFENTNVTDPGAAGIQLSNNTGSVNFGTTNIDLGTTAGTAGIDFINSNDTTTFGTVTISDVGAGDNQVGVDFNGANLTNQIDFESVAISGPVSSTSSIGVDLTGIQGNQLVNMGSNVDPANGPSSSIVNTHRGVLIDPTASVHFTFGDGESGADIGSTINVNNADDFSYTVDAGGGTLGSASFNFDDVVVGAGDEANFPAAPSNLEFVSTAGGVITAGTNGLNVDVMTIDPFQAEAQANVGQTFVFVGDAGGIVDVALGAVDGFTLDAGQSIDGFNNGNSFIFGTLQPVNISGNLGVAGGNITANSATVINSDRFSNSIVNVAGGNSTIANNIFDGTLDAAWIGSPANDPVAVINVAGAANDVSIIGSDITNISDIPVTHVGINLDNNTGNVTLMDVALTGANAGTGLQIDETAASTGQITGDANTSLGATTGTVVSIGAGARDVNLGATTTTSSLNTSTAIIIDGQSGGNITFGDVTLNGGTGSSAIFSENQTGGSLSFGTVDVGGMTGFNNAAGQAVLVDGTNGTVNFTEIDINAVSGIGFVAAGVDLSITNATNSITTNSGSGLLLINTNLIGGVTFDQVNSTNGIFGILASNTTGNLMINGGDLIDNAQDDFSIIGGTVDVTFGGNINRGIGGSAVDITTGHTGTVTFMTGTINATNGDGLQFDNADGTYNFNGAVTLNGGDAGIDILNGSAGTFTFADTTINNSTGVAVNMDSSPGTLNLNNLDINQSVGNGVQANNSGTVNLVGTIDNTTGDGINLVNTGFATTGVTIGFDGNIGDDGIDISNTDATNRTVTVQNSNIFNIAGDSIADRGITIDSSGTGTLTANITTTQIASDNEAIFATSGANAAALVLDLSDVGTLQSNNAVPTMSINGGGLDSTIVTSLGANTIQVIGNGTSGGVLFNQVTFDASGAALGGTQVTGGTLIVGSGAGAATRVQGDGVSFLATSGDIAFTELDVFNNLGTGLEVDTKSPPGPTTFNLVTGANSTIDTTNGSAMFLDPLTGDLSFDAVTSTNATALGATSLAASGNGAGVHVEELTASGGAGTNALNIGTLNISGPATNGLSIINTVGNVTVGTGGTIESNGGTAVNVTGGNATVALNNVTVNATGGTAVDINGGSMGDVSFINSDITQLDAGRAIQVDGATAGNILFDGDGSVTATVANNTGININNSGANVTVANATLSNTVGDAVSISGGTGQMNFDNLDVANSGGDGIQSVDLAGTLMVQNGSSFTNIAGDGINVDNSVATATVVQVLGTAGVNTFDTIGDDAVSVTNSTGNITLSDVNSTGVTGDMLQQTNHTGTTTVTNGLTLVDLALGGTAIANFINQTGTVNVNDALMSNLIINGGNANFNFNAGTMLVNTNNTATIDITNHTGGTVDFDGTINATNGSGLQFNNADGTYDFSGTVTLNGGDAGIDIIGGSAGTFTFSNTTLINNAAGGMGVNMDGTAGASLTFSGGLDIATTDGIGFNATGGGTIAVSATAGTEQIITNGTGGAINVDGVAVAGGGVSFDQITTAGTTTDQGIDINNATGGTFTFTNVSLDGTAVTTGLDISGDARSSDVVVTGGTINNGVRINNSGTGTVMIGADITDNAGFAVQVANRAAGSGDVTVSGNVNNNSGSVSIMANSGGLVNFTGTVTGTGSNTAGAIDIDNNTGGTTNFNGLVDIDVTGNGTGVQIGANNQLASAVNFNAGLDINSVDGTAFEALSGTVGVANAGTESVVTTGTAGAINLDNTSTQLAAAAGGISFDQVTTGATATSEGIDINGVGGGTLTFTSVSLDGTAVTTGLDISGNARSSNVVVTGGTINNGVRINNSGTGTVMIGADITDNAGFAVQVANRGAGAGDVTVSGNVNNNTGSVSIMANSDGLVNFTGMVTGTGSNTAGAIDIDNNTGGTTNFNGLVDIDVTGAGTGVQIGANNQLASAVNFNAGLDINSVDGTGFEALSGTVGVANAGTESVVTTGTAGAINLDNTSTQLAVAAGGITFDQVTTGATATSEGIDINGVGGGAITFANVSLDGTAVTTGLDISGNARSSNVVVTAGTINNGVRINNSGSGTVMIGADITDNAGFAVQVANRGAGAGDVTVSGNVNNNTGSVSIMANSDGLVNFTGMVTGTGSNTAGAIDIDNNTGGTTNFNGLVDLDVTGAGTGVQIGAANTAAAAINFNSGLEINSTTATAFEALSGTLGIADAGSRFIATTSGTALNLDGVTLAAGGANFGSIGNSLAATTVVIDLNDISGGALTADNAAILTGNGIDISGTIGSAITFDNVDIALNAMNQTAVDLSGATINANLSFGDFDVTSTSAVGTTGVDIAGTTGTGTIQLGDTNTNGGPSVSVGAVGMELASGVNVDATTDLNFILGDGDGTVGPGSDGVASTMTVTNAVTGVLPANGTYNFADIDFTTSNVNNLLGANVYFVDAATNGDGSSQTTAGTIVGAEASGADAIILIDGTAGAGGNVIDMSAGIHAGSGGGVNTLDLADGQLLFGLTAGEMIDLSTFGLGGAPVNFITNLGGTSVITGLAGLEAAPTLTTNNGDTIVGAGTIFIDGITATNTGTGNALSNVTPGTGEIAILDSTFTGGTAGAGILLDGASTATITQFTDVTVVGAGGNGVDISNITFDADGGTAGGGDANFTGDVVGGAGNDLSIGQTGTVSGIGLRLNNVSGDLSFGDVDVTSTGTGLDITGSASFDGAAGTGFRLTTVTGDINSTGAAGILFDPFTSNVALTSVTSNGGTHGILLDSIDGSFTVSGTVDANNATVAGIEIDSTGTGLDANFNGLVDIDGTTGIGVSLEDNAIGTVDFAALQITTTTGAGFSANNGGAITFNSGFDIDTTTGTGLSIINGGVNATTIGGAPATIDTTTGEILNISAATVNGTITSASASALNGSKGIDINNHAGNLTITGGTINNAGTGESIEITGGAGTLNIGTSVSTTSNSASGLAIDVINRTGGTVTISGNLSDTNGLGGGIDINGNGGGAIINLSGTSQVVNTGTQTAVDITSNTGATVNITGGGLDIDTTSGVGFNATGGGTITVQGTGNTVNTTTGSAVNIVNTTIGGSGVTFQGVSANGAASGIILNNTGAGGFIITGDGTTNRNNSGGTIQNTTGSAILLTNASNIDINHLNITDAGIHAIDGTGVNNFTFRHSTVSGIGPAAVDDHNAFNFVTGAQSVIGTVLVDNVAFTNFEDTAIDIANTSGTVNVTVSNSVFSNNHATFGNEAIAVDSQNTALFNLNVTGNTFTNVQGDAVAARVGGSGGTHDINITGNTSTHALNVGGGDFLIQMTNGADVTFDINNNTVDHASQLLSGDPIQIVGNGDAEGRIVGNTLSGYGGDAIRLDMGGSTAASAGNITWTILIQNNDIGVLGNPGASRSGTADEAIEIFSRDHSGTLNVTIDNNRIHNPLSRAVNLFSDEDSPSGTGPTNNIAIINNTFTGVPGDSIRIRSTDADPITTCAHIVGNTGSGGIFLDEDTTPTGTSIEITQASLAALNAANTGLTANQNDGAIGFNGGCNMVSLPTNP